MSGAVREISVDELAAAQQHGARVFDVRELAEFEAGRVPGAVLIPLGEVTQRVDEFRGEGPAYLVCRSGARSMRACEFLVQQGIEAVNVAGGTIAWLDAGHPLDEGQPFA